VHFSELNGKTIKDLSYVSKIVSRFYIYIYIYIYIHELLWEYLLVNGYYMARIEEGKYMSDPMA
jgi:hypothetical protein